MRSPAPSGSGSVKPLSGGNGGGRGERGPSSRRASPSLIGGEGKKEALPEGRAFLFLQLLTLAGTEEWLGHPRLISGYLPQENPTKRVPHLQVLLRKKSLSHSDDQKETPVPLPELGRRHTPG
jgi:hypothetical protein